MQSSEGWPGGGGGLYVFSIVVIEMTPNRQPAKFKGCHKFVNLSSFLFGLYYIERERHCNITVCMASIYSQVGKTGSNFDWTLYRRRYMRAGHYIILCVLYFSIHELCHEITFSLYIYIYIQQSVGGWSDRVSQKIRPLLKQFPAAAARQKPNGYTQQQQH